MILITGSRGFIGSRLLAYLTGKGYEVEGMNEEITDIEKLKPYFKNAEFVVHLAGKKPNSKIGDKCNDVFQVNVVGTMNIVRLCLEHNSKLINISSTATQSDYGISKILAQELIRLYAKYQGLRAVTIRSHGIYDEHNGITPYINKNYPLGKLLEDIENIIAYYDFKKYKVYRTRNIQQKIYFVRRKARALKRKIQGILR
ncbi:MAG: SDR family oxidoreductase [Minisyncoccia bacterium]|jgi:nucleoside-diphosphate-sugar epimerase